MLRFLNRHNSVAGHVSDHVPFRLESLPQVSPVMMNDGPKQDENSLKMVLEPDDI